MLTTSAWDELLNVLFRVFGLASEASECKPGTDDTLGLSNTVRIASAFSLIHFCIPICEASVESGSKQLMSKWSLHNTLCLLEPDHWALVLCTCFTHFSRKIGSFENLKKLTFLLYVLEHHAAMQRFTMVVSFARSTSLARERRNSAFPPWRHVNAPPN